MFVYYGCYFLMTALLLAILYQRARFLFSRAGWAMLAAAVLIGAFTPVLVQITGAWAAFSILLALAIGLAWFSWRRGAEKMADREASRANQPQRKQAGESKVQPESPWKTGREVLLAYEEAAAGKEGNLRMDGTVTSTEAAADRTGQDSPDAMEFDFLPDGPAVMEPEPAISGRERRTLAAVEEEDDQIIYFFDDEPSSLSEKRESSSEAAQTGLLLAEELEWKFVKDNG
ncbi:hypothetical protein ACFSO0_03575 [Brevibacillus sp. GCM10020057]|uniref:hypothetical protein n=1 Tax=Brevibacillus sp. GCM10020057 TaxID=3317327 RepID=UPI0036421450